MSETVRDVLERVGRGHKLGSLHGDAFKLYGEIVEMLGYAHLFDAPIVCCGDSRVVLAVNREELAEAYEDAARKAVDTNDHTAGPLAGVDALLAKLDLREVEAIGHIHDNDVGDPSYYFYAGTVDEGNYRTLDAYDIDEVAVLKPVQASKERER